ncbi:MAG: tetratricopeptide repeat protein [Endomicrobia bacterium]|nr:tetratricopeptide repeat protein [Endomicrobiia bacterium]
MSKFERFTNFLTKQIRENRTRFFTVLGFTAGFIILAVFIFVRLQTLNESASDRLAAAYMFLMNANRQEAMSHLNYAIAYSGKTPASYQARLVKADMLMDEKNYGAALPLLKETAEKGKPDLIRPLAMVRIIYAYDQQNDYQSAILASNEFIEKYPDHFLIRNVYLNLARYYQLTDSPEDAKRIYGEVLVKFPATKEAEYAEKVLRGLN